MTHDKLARLAITTINWNAKPETYTVAHTQLHDVYVGGRDLPTRRAPSVNTQPTRNNNQIR